MRSGITSMKNQEEIAPRLSKNPPQLHFRSHRQKFADAFIETALERVLKILSLYPQD